VREARSWWTRWVPWAAIVAAVGAALTLGSGILGPGHHQAASLYQRTLQVAGQYRCPVCAGESAAASEAPEAAEMRKLIEGWLAEGRSTAQIRSYLVADFGSSILEEPPASGLDILVWLLPGLVAAFAATGLGVAFARRRLGRARARPAGEQEPGGPRRAATAGWHRRGHVVWRTTSGKTAWPSLQRASLVAGATLMVAGGGLWALDRIGGGHSPSGSAAQLRQASALAAANPVRALEIYDEVLAHDPRQPAALAAEGWIYFEAGFATRGMALLADAENADPQYAPAHLYRGLALLGEGRRPAAASELRWYLTHRPAPDTSGIARQALKKAEAKAGVR